MFFYRHWIDNKFEHDSIGGTYDTFATSRWGFAALLLLTLLAGILLNGAVLGAFIFEWKNLKKLPHTLIFTLCLRDLLVALILIPICVDW